jgi:hypothetical protein
MHDRYRREQFLDAGFPPVSLGERHLIIVVPALLKVLGRWHGVKLGLDVGLRCSRLHTDGEWGFARAQHQGARCVS